jgi:haloacid dehalogenase superfamily, subfamily IA, variant 1 with third motif having Dx(3-4)D or Dx(3-4)E
MDKGLVEQLELAVPAGLAGMIFDCDGVLLDSRDSNIMYYNLVRRYFGLPPISEADECYVHMHTGMQSLSRVLPAPYLQRLGEAMQGIDYMRDLVPHITLQKGITGLLQWLAEKGMWLAVHTNRTTLADDVLLKFGLKEFFDIVVTAKTHQPKPSPEGIFAILDAWGLGPERVMFVGDSLLDEKAAAAAGVALAAYRNPELAGAVHIDDFDEFRRALGGFLK